MPKYTVWLQLIMVALVALLLPLINQLVGLG